jgi:hypothetical protein
MNLVLKDGATIVRSASKIALPLVAKLTTRGEARRTASFSSAMTSRLPCVKNVALALSHYAQLKCADVDRGWNVESLMDHKTGNGM